MRSMTRHGILTAVLLTLCAAPTVAEEVVSRIYQIQHLDPNEAGLLARQKCLETGSPECEYRVKGGGHRSSAFVEFFTDSAGQELVAVFLAERDRPPRTQLFQVTLLAASHDGGKRPQLPPSAEQALDDLEQFLPYRSYRVLDSGIMRTMGEARLSLGGELGYRAAISFVSDPMSDEIKVGAFELERHYRSFVREADGGGHYDQIEKGVTSSQFSMKIGETVVVGTSKLNGGEEALIVLLTAVKE